MRMIGVAKLRNGLYTIATAAKGVPSFSSANVASVNNFSCNDSLVWLCRLGHPSHQKLFVLHSQFLFISCILNKEPCEPCLLAKQRRLPFFVTNTKSDSVFALIHADI